MKQSEQLESKLIGLIERWDLGGHPDFPVNLLELIREYGESRHEDGYNSALKDAEYE